MIATSVPRTLSLTYEPPALTLRGWEHYAVWQDNNALTLRTELKPPDMQHRCDSASRSLNAEPDLQTRLPKYDEVSAGHEGPEGRIEYLGVIDFRRRRRCSFLTGWPSDRLVE